MTSGSPHSWFADEPVVVPDLAADFFATPLAHEPGSYFNYTGLGAWCGPGDGTFTMAGRHGQLCIVSPPREAVVTITAHVEEGSARTSITTLVTEELLNRLWN